MALPDFLTIEEAAKVLRLGRTAAYAAAARYEATGGAEGLPVVRFGRLLRVPRAQLERIAGGPLADAPSAAHADVQPLLLEPAQRAPRRRPSSPDQAPLPLG